MTKNKVSFGWGYLLIGLLLSIVGAAFIMFSNVLDIVAAIIGVTLVAFGAVYVAIAFSRQNRDFGFAVKLVVAVMCITAGIITIFLREGAALLMADIFCLLLIVDGSFKFQTAALSKRYNAFGWWFMLALSVITIISSFIVTKLEVKEGQEGVITVIIGIIIILDGIANFFTAFYEAYCERKRMVEYNTPETEADGVQLAGAPVEEDAEEEDVEEDEDTEEDNTEDVPVEDAPVEAPIEDEPVEEDAPVEAPVEDEPIEEDAPVEAPVEDVPTEE